MSTQEKLELAERRIAELEQEIIKLKGHLELRCVQFNRLMDGRDAEIILRNRAEKQIRSLQRKLDRVDAWRFDRFVDLNASGADRADNPDYKTLQHLKRILDR